MCVFDVISIVTKKIVDFEILVHESKKREGNTDVSPGALEGQAFIKMFGRLKGNKKINEVIKDGDVEIDNIIHGSDWDVTITHDPNHELKNFEKKYTKFIQPRKGCFRGVKSYIYNTFVDILYTFEDKTLRLSKIDDIFTALLNDEVLQYGKNKKKFAWKHSNDQECRELILDVINYCKDLSNRFTRYHTSNYNEAFHALKAKFVPKNFNLGNTGRIRLLAAILEYNDPDTWLQELYRRLSTYIPQDGYTRELFKRIRNRNINRINKKRERNFRKRRRQLMILLDQEQEQRERDMQDNIPFHT